LLAFQRPADDLGDSSHGFMKLDHFRRHYLPYLTELAEYVDGLGVPVFVNVAGHAVDDYLTGRENVVMVARLYDLPKQEAEHRADEVLEAIHLTDAADRPVRTYSGGMRRRLDVAAVLASLYPAGTVAGGSKC